MSGRLRMTLQDFNLRNRLARPITGTVEEWRAPNTWITLKMMEHGWIGPLLVSLLSHLFFFLLFSLSFLVQNSTCKSWRKSKLARSRNWPKSTATFRGHRAGCHHRTTRTGEARCKDQVKHPTVSEVLSSTLASTPTCSEQGRLRRGRTAPQAFREGEGHEVLRVWRSSFTAMVPFSFDPLICRPAALLEFDYHVFLLPHEAWAVSTSAR